MNPILLTSLLDVLYKGIDRLFPDKAAADKAKAELALVAQNQEFQRDLAQIALNAEEAKNPSMFVSGWRPAVGWTCALAFMLHFLIFPLLNFLLVLAGYKEVAISFDMTTLLSVLGGMLGIGGLRTVEKIRNVARV